MCGRKKLALVNGMLFEVEEYIHDVAVRIWPK
jgi:hypothetical protein